MERLRSSEDSQLTEGDSLNAVWQLSRTLPRKDLPGLLVTKAPYHEAIIARYTINAKRYAPALAYLLACDNSVTLGIHVRPNYSMDCREGSAIVAEAGQHTSPS